MDNTDERNNGIRNVINPITFMRAPCVPSSMLYGALSAIAIYGVATLFTRQQISRCIGIVSFGATTLCYLYRCRRDVVLKFRRVEKDEIFNDTIKRAYEALREDSD